ncbi:ROK family protein [Clostridium drakei]|uniref:Sugar kinase n=1 Tax=Clostridium drakei TaxID=332101 RepID=A0A2U8DV95_9CLOT|nr:ROK family protein [Clostridium drakei]AWI05992.1 sugar kinase [Clostridium drakei]
MKKILRELSNRELETLNIIQKKGLITKKSIQAITDMTLTTLNRVMKSLEDKKLIAEAGISKSTGGRKAVKYSVAENGLYAIGVDISRTYVRIIILNLKMTILAKEEFFMNDTFSPEKTVEKIGNLINEELLKLSIDKNEVLGIGIGTVGQLDREKGIMLNPENFFNEDWGNVPIRDMLEKKTLLPCFIDNGTNAAVLAEYLFGKGKDLKNVVYIHCGIGIRSAVINNGIIIRTMRDSEDSFAHMVIDFNGEKCSCGNKGCLESYSSINAIVKSFNSTLKNNSDSVNEEIKEEDYKKILELAVHNNKTAVEIINKGAEILGVGLANMVRILNPQLVILYGTLIKNYKLYYNKCIDAFNKNNCLNNEVIFSDGGEFKENAIAVGSGLIVIENYLKKTGIGGK